YSLLIVRLTCFFFFSSRRRHTRSDRDWSSDVCSSDLVPVQPRAVRPDLRGARIIVEVNPATRLSISEMTADVEEEIDVVHRLARSEERRVGKEGRSRGGVYD